jgi:putative transposase
MARARDKNGGQVGFEAYVLRQRMTSGHGGPREGAGRKRSGRSHVQHRRRHPFRKLTPAHVTLRVVEGITGLRSRTLVAELRKTFAAACERGDFRLVEYSIQDNHLHLIIEAESQRALSRGMMSISARFAHAVNRIFERSGPVIAGRYHVQLLTTAKQVHHALRYVLLNARKHYAQRRGHAPPVKIDAASSGSHFDGWLRKSEGLHIEAATREEVGVAESVSWLLRVGWRRWGLIDPSEIPG